MQQMSIESVLIKISEKFEKWPDPHNILDAYLHSNDLEH